MTSELPHGMIGSPHFILCCRCKLDYPGPCHINIAHISAILCPVLFIGVQIAHGQKIVFLKAIANSLFNRMIMEQQAGANFLSKGIQSRLIKVDFIIVANVI